MLSVLGVGVGCVLNLQPPTQAYRGRPVHCAGSLNPRAPPPLAAVPPRPVLELSNLPTTLVRKNNELASTENSIRVHNAIAGIPGQQGE